MRMVRMCGYDAFSGDGYWVVTIWSGFDMSEKRSFISPNRPRFQRWYPMKEFQCRMMEYCAPVLAIKSRHPISECSRLMVSSTPYRLLLPPFPNQENKAADR